MTHQSNYKNSNDWLFQSPTRDWSEMTHSIQSSCTYLKHNPILTDLTYTFNMSGARMNFSAASEAAVNQHIMKELEAYYKYQSISSWLNRDDISLPGLAAYYYKAALGVDYTYFDDTYDFLGNWACQQTDQLHGHSWWSCCLQGYCLARQ